MRKCLVSTFAHLCVCVFATNVKFQVVRFGQQLFLWKDVYEYTHKQGFSIALSLRRHVFYFVICSWVKYSTRRSCS